MIVCNFMTMWLNPMVYNSSIQHIYILNNNSLLPQLFHTMRLSFPFQATFLSIFKTYLMHTTSLYRPCGLFEGIHMKKENFNRDPCEKGEFFLTEIHMKKENFNREKVYSLNFLWTGPPKLVIQKSRYYGNKSKQRSKLQCEDWSLCSRHLWQPS